MFVHRRTMRCIARLQVAWSLQDFPQLCPRSCRNWTERCRNLEAWGGYIQPPTCYQIRQQVRSAQNAFIVCGFSCGFFSILCIALPLKMFESIKQSALYQELSLHLVFIGCFVSLGAMGFGFDNSWWGRCSWSVAIWQEVRFLGRS